ncbi:MAG: hypothetical protein IKL62_04675 [Clostridia bacterium]|nr:hypothetical protein [Clostridia bacterium]
MNDNKDNKNKKLTLDKLAVGAITAAVVCGVVTLVVTFFSALAGSTNTFKEPFWWAVLVSIAIGTFLVCISWDTFGGDKGDIGITFGVVALVVSIVIFIVIGIINGSHVEEEPYRKPNLQDALDYYEEHKYD